MQRFGSVMRLLSISMALTAGVTITALAVPLDAPLGTVKPHTPLLLEQMVGNWNVQEKMWPAAGAKAVDLPAGQPPSGD